MTTIIYPLSDFDRQVILTAIVETGEKEHLAGRERIPRPLLDEVHRVQTLFDDHYRTLRDLQITRKQMIAKRDQAFKKLNSFVRAFRSSVRWRVKLYDWAPSYLGFFHIKSALPHPLSWQKLFNLARQYEQGDARAVAKGYIPMMNPSANELRAKLHEAERLEAEAGSAALAADRAQNEMVPLREEVDLLIKQVSKQLDLSLMRLPADDIRHIKRVYGFRYRD